MIPSTNPHESLANRIKSLEQSLERISDACMGFDTMMNFVFVNSGAGRLLNKHPEDLVGRNFWKEFEYQTDKPLGKAFRQAFDTQQTITIHVPDTEEDSRITYNIYPGINGLSVFAQKTYGADSLLRTDKQLRAVLEGLPGGVLVADEVTHEFLFANESFCSLLGYNQEEVKKLTLNNLHRAADMPRVLEDFQKIILGEINQSLKIPTLRKDQTTFMADVHSVMLQLDGRNCICGIFTDVTVQYRSEQLQQSRNAILEMILKDMPLAHVLREIVLAIESLSDEVIASILLLDPNGKQMRTGAAPNLPIAFSNTADGLAIGPKVGSCGTAMFRKEPVIVTDIASDPLWEDSAAFAVSFGLRACWSTPILDGKGQVLGSFAMYRLEPGQPTPEDLSLIDDAIHLAALAIEKHQREEAIKAANKQVEERETLLTQAQKIGNMGHWVIDFERNELSWSEEIYTLFGRNPSDGIATFDEFLELVYPDDRDLVDRSFKLHLEKGAEYNLVHRIITTKGELAYVHQRCQTTFNEAGAPIRSLGVVADVTEIKVAEQALLLRIAEIEIAQEEVNKIHEVMYLTLNGAHDAVVTINEQQEIIFVNEATERIFGYQREELLGKNHNILLPDSLKTLHKNYITDHLYAGKKQVTAHPRDFEITRRDGEKLWVQVSLSRIEYHGEVQFTAFIQDISERKQAEAESYLLRQAINSSSIGIVLSDANDPNLPLMFVNPAFEAITGYASQEVLGENCNFLQGSDTNQPQLELIREGIKKGESANAILRNYRKDGSLFWNQLTLSPLYNQEGKLTHFVGLQKDITELKEAEEALYYYTLALEQRNTQLDTLINTVPDLIWLKDKQGVYMRCNSRFESLTGKSSQEMVGGTDYDFFDKELADFFRANDKAVIAYGSSIMNEELYSSLRGLR